MGNSPSTSKPTTPSSSTRDSPKLPKREPKSINAPGQQRVAIPPEKSMAQATGSSIVKPQSRSAPNFPADDNESPTRTSSSSSRPEPSKPVAVPASHTEPSSLRSQNSGRLIHPIPNTESTQDENYLTHPPRLPLPIEEEIHTPGSPIMAPMGTGEPLEGLDLDEPSDPALARNTSLLSSSSHDDEDEEELRIEKHRPMVPTRIEWTRGGDKIYVTGTIFNWNRKMKLEPVEEKPGVFAKVVNILPGTHHLRFLVDGSMTTSPDLPTTVDFGNNLVNYIEVSSDDVDAEDSVAKGKMEEERAKRKRQAPPVEAYCSEISQYLLDYDQTEENQDYLDGVAAIQKLPTPPSLPGFLTKPILNRQSHVKDDNSVLTMPNHTVLNHLATSSIKHNILALSATTRYRNKYVTTIIYKPALDDVS